MTEDQVKKWATRIALTTVVKGIPEDKFEAVDFLADKLLGFALLCLETERKESQHADPVTQEG